MPDPQHDHDPQHGHDLPHAHDPEGHGGAPARQHAHGSADAADAAEDAGTGGRQLPEATLQLHLFHLASQVTMALGEIENPLSGKREKDLPTARFLIDLIAMLEAKTAGNRTEDEDAYLRGVLTNLRMAYVAKAK